MRRINRKADTKIHVGMCVVSLRRTFVGLEDIKIKIDDVFIIDSYSDNISVCAMTNLQGLTATNCKIIKDDPTVHRFRVGYKNEMYKFVRKVRGYR